MKNKEPVAAFMEAMLISDIATRTEMIASGQVAHMKEYMNTYHAKTTFGL